MTPEQKARHQPRERRPVAEYDARGEVIHETDHRLVCAKDGQLWPCNVADLIEEGERLRAAAHRLVTAYEQFEGSHWNDEEVAYRDLRAALAASDEAAPESRHDEAGR